MMDPISGSGPNASGVPGTDDGTTSATAAEAQRILQAGPVTVEVIRVADREFFNRYEEGRAVVRTAENADAFDTKERAAFEAIAWLTSVYGTAAHRRTALAGLAPAPPPNGAPAVPRSLPDRPDAPPGNGAKPPRRLRLNAWLRDMMILRLLRARARGKAEYRAARDQALREHVVTLPQIAGMMASIKRNGVAERFVHRVLAFAKLTEEDRGVLAVELQNLTGVPADPKSPRGGRSAARRRPGRTAAGTPHLRKPDAIRLHLFRARAKGDHAFAKAKESIMARHGLDPRGIAGLLTSASGKFAASFAQRVVEAAEPAQQRALAKELERLLNDGRGWKRVKWALVRHAAHRAAAGRS